MLEKPILRTKDHTKDFKGLYGAPLFAVYKEVIEAFFNGKSHFQDESPFERQDDGALISKGNIWVSEHQYCETLTVEPMDCSQFEIAVRVKHGTGAWKGEESYKYSGYCIPYVCYEGLKGFDTSGH